MASTYHISEHDTLPAPLAPMDYNPALGAGLCLNPEAEPFLRRMFVEWRQWPDGVFRYSASYCIGAQGLDQTHSTALTVSTDKIGSIDFMRMFNECLACPDSASGMYRIYGIDTSAPRIEAPHLSSVVTPLLAVHYLAVLHRLVQRNLRCGYVERHGNLRSVKGSLCVPANHRANILPGHRERIFCRYCEYTADTPENRLLKRALLFAGRIISRSAAGRHYPAIEKTLAECRAAFAAVSDSVDTRSLRRQRSNRLYSEYPAATALARRILRYEDFCLSNLNAPEVAVHPFWIDMPVLFELYVLGLLRKAFGKSIEYQAKGITGYPDFLYTAPGAPAILDTKYIALSERPLDTYIVRQLAGYSRDSAILGRLGATDSDVVPCVCIYPDPSALPNPFAGGLSGLQPVPGLSRFYTLPIRLPQLSKA